MLRFTNAEYIDMVSWYGFCDESGRAAEDLGRYTHYIVPRHNIFKRFSLFKRDRIFPKSLCRQIGFEKAEVVINAVERRSATSIRGTSHTMEILQINV